MRNIISINDNWRFLKHEMPVEAAMQYASHGETVALPHTWNAVDGQDGGNDYHRGQCWYVRELLPKELRGERTFLEFLGAFHTAAFYLIGTEIARHEGGYSSLRVDLSVKLSPE